MAGNLTSGLSYLITTVKSTIGMGYVHGIRLLNAILITNLYNIIFFRNRVAVQLQKNLDRVRLRRIQQKLSTGSNPGYEISSPPATKVENGENESKVHKYAYIVIFF